MRPSWCLRCLLRLLRQVVLVFGCDMRLTSLLVHMLLERRPCLLSNLNLLCTWALGLLLWGLVLSSLGLVAFGSLRIGFMFLFRQLVLFMQSFGSSSRASWLIAFFTSLFLGKLRGLRVVIGSCFWLLRMFAGLRLDLLVETIWLGLLLRHLVLLRIRELLVVFGCFWLLFVCLICLL